MKNEHTKQGGIGFIGTLTLMFIVLKLTNNIKWTWVWVLSPIWISAVLFAVSAGIILICGRIKKGKW